MKQARISPRLVVGLVVTGLLLWGLYASIEFYEEEVKTRWSLEAYRNPYLAAQQFMKGSGIEVVDADSLVKLDTLEGVSTLFITDANQIISPRQLQQVLTWLEQGGNVIVTANSVANTDDLLLREFNVEVSLREYDSDKKVKSKSMSERILTHPHIEGKGYDASQPEPSSWSASDYGIHLMQFDVGSGLLTIISDSTIWTSYRIEQYDHAFLLWMLSSRDGDFAILYPQLRDSLWQLTIKHASELLIAVALVMHRKRSIDLIAPLRQRVLRRASLSLGEFARAEPDRQMELIGRRCGINTDSISRALHETEFNETSFVHTVKLLKHIEQSL